MTLDGGCTLPKQIGQTLSGFSDSSQILLISGDEVRVILSRCSTGYHSLSLTSLDCSAQGSDPNCASSFFRWA